MLFFTGGSGPKREAPCRPLAHVACLSATDGVPLVSGADTRLTRVSVVLLLLALRLSAWHPSSGLLLVSPGFSACTSSPLSPLAFSDERCTWATVRRPRRPAAPLPARPVSAARVLAVCPLPPLAASLLLFPGLFQPSHQEPDAHQKPGGLHRSCLVPPTTASWHPCAESCDVGCSFCPTPHLEADAQERMPPSRVCGSDDHPDVV